MGLPSDKRNHIGDDFADDPCILFLYVIFASFSDPVKLMGNSSLLLKPLGFSLNAYKKVFVNPSIYSGYLNTIFLHLFRNSVRNQRYPDGGICLIQEGSFRKECDNQAFVFTMFFSGGLIPTYMVVSSFIW